MSLMRHENMHEGSASRGACAFHVLDFYKAVAKQCCGMIDSAVAKQISIGHRCTRHESTRDGTRTRNLLLRTEAPYPLGHTSND